MLKLFSRKWIAPILLILIGAIIFICIGLFRYKQKQKLASLLPYIESYDKNMAKYDNLKGVYLNPINQIIDSLPSGNSIVYLFSSSDCGSCIDQGFSLMEQLQKEDITIPFFAISDNAAISGIQDRNNYRNYVYTDDESLIRKHLKFCLTPVLFLLSDGIIQELYFPTNESDIHGRSKFYNAVLEGLK